METDPLFVASFATLVEAGEVCSESLTAEEAIFTIGTMAMLSDADIQVEETDALNDCLAAAGLSEAQVAAINAKIGRIVRDEGVGPLLRGALQALPTERRLDALRLAMRVARADGITAPEELEFLQVLVQALQLDGRVLNEVDQNSVSTSGSSITG